MESKKTGEHPILKIVRRFSTPPEPLFDSFTDPEFMRAWWTTDTEFEIDLRPGGRWTITRPEGGELLVMTGEYIEVSRPNRLRYTISMPRFSPNQDEVLIEIESVEGGSRLTFIQSGEDIAAELRDLPQGTVSESEKGWSQGFDLIAKALEKSSAQ